MRLSATRSLFERRDVIIVASVSCIYGLGSPEAYYGMLLFARQGDTLDRRRPPRPAGGGPLRPQRHRPAPGHVPRPGRRGRDRPRLRGERHPHRALRRRGREDQRLRPPHREDDGAAGPGGDLPVEPLRDPPAPPRRRHQDDRGRAPRGEAEARGPGQAPRGPAALPAHDVRPGDAPGDRALPRHRELLPPPLGAGPGRAAADAPRLPAEGRAHRGRRVAPVHSPGPRACTTATAAQEDPGGVRLPAAVGPRQPAAELRGVRGAGRPGPLRLGDAGPLRAAEVRGGGGGAGHPPHRAHGPARSRSARSRARWTTCWPRSAPAPRRGSACW